jgi:hypothetical protein
MRASGADSDTTPHGGASGASAHCRNADVRALTHASHATAGVGIFTQHGNMLTYNRAAESPEWWYPGLAGPAGPGDTCWEHETLRVGSPQEGQHRWNVRVGQDAVASGWLGV